MSRDHLSPMRSRADAIIQDDRNFFFKLDTLLL